MDCLPAALGFLRTYAHLIKHESDFRIAKGAHLLPEHVTYTTFQIFIEPFRHLTDEAVSPRYHYGQIRLTRLNWAIRIFRPVTLGKALPLYYRNPYVQTNQYSERFGAPLLFLFASLTLVLSSMQVVLAAQGENTWRSFIRVSWSFSVAAILLVLALSFLACIAVLVHFLRQLIWGIRLQRRVLINIKNIGPQDITSAGASQIC